MHIRHTLKQLHTAATLKKKWIEAASHTEKVRWHALYLWKTDVPTKTILLTLGRSDWWLQQTVHRFNTQGSYGVEDRRCDNGGHMVLLTKPQQQKLRACILEEKPPDGGLWTGPKIARWIGDITGKKVHPHRGWKYSQRLGLSLLVPRPAHTESATPAEQTAFKKNSPTR